MCRFLSDHELATDREIMDKAEELAGEAQARECSSKHGEGID